MPAKGFRHATVLLVEQNVELALDIADRAYVPDQGAVVHHAAARELLADNDIKERYCSVWSRPRPWLALLVASQPY